MVSGTSAPPHVSPWVLLGEHGYTGVRAGKLAFPKNPVLVNPLNTGPAIQPSSKSWERAVFCLTTQREESDASCSSKQLLNSHEPEKPWDNSLSPQ